ncbi:HAD family hydrolase [Candidatus Woesearchaeota archaeon]|nr:HAD family hydrolase [Candidatus Woesearchaeota archaeon]
MVKNKVSIKQYSTKKKSEKNSNGIKLIMFDYDGTLMDTFTLTCHIYNEIFRQFRIDKSFTKRQFQELFESNWRNCLIKFDLVKEEQWDKAMEIYITITKDFEEEIRCYPYVMEMIPLLHKKYKLAIISNGDKEIIVSRLKKYNLLQYFDYISGNDEGEKPSPEPLIKCMQKLKITPEQAVYVGDMDGDIAAGKAAQVNKVVAVTYGYHHHSKLQDADFVIDVPEKLLDVLTKSI